MYKCIECGTEYKEKPDYCDCGNDEFELVQDVNSDSVVMQNKSEETNIKSEQVQKPQPASSISAEKDKKEPKISKPVDILSLFIFIFCIILSLIVIFSNWGTKESDIENSGNDKVEVNITKDIPSIDNFWNNSLPEVQKELIQEVKKDEQKPVIQEVKTIPAIKQVVQKQNNQTVKPKITTVLLKKNKTVNPQKIINDYKTQQKNTMTTTVKKNTNTELANKKLEEERKAAEEIQLKKLKELQQKEAEAEKLKQSAVAKQEFSNYKINLRNAIGRKIDFTKVIGDGSCTVSFKIDANGRLVSRSFTKQSTNNTLNDAVYAAVMSTPTFTPPPSGYKNEVLNLSISFYNGNFTISLQ